MYSLTSVGLLCRGKVGFWIMLTFVKGTMEALRSVMMESTAALKKSPTDVSMVLVLVMAGRIHTQGALFTWLLR